MILSPAMQSKVALNVLKGAIKTGKMSVIDAHEKGAKGTDILEVVEAIMVLEEAHGILSFLSEGIVKHEEERKVGKDDVPTPKSTTIH